MTEQLVTDDAVTQFAVLDALLAGAYASGIPVSEVRRLGDFGLGCCDHLGGEVIILDGEVFECTVDDPPTLMTDDEILPFVDVCRFPEASAQPVNGVDLAALTERIEDDVVSRNLFHAVRIDGVFSSITVRVTPRQDDRLRPLAEVTARQIETELSDIRGTVVGFWSPAIYQGIAVAGLHIHFLAEDRSAGGHVLDVVVAEGELTLAAFAHFNLRLPTDELFLRTELTHDEDHRIVAVEGGVGK
jgi:acetolactate decarboxylase